MSGSDPRKIRTTLEAAEGYAVFDSEGKRLGAFVELAADDRIAIRHDGVFVWHRRLLPITDVVNVIPDQRAVVLKVSKRTLADTKAPASQAPEPSSRVAGEKPPPSEAWHERVERYVGPLEGDADRPDLSHNAAAHEPHDEDVLSPVAHKEDPSPPTPARKDQDTGKRQHLLFIATPAGYSLAEQEGPLPRRGDRVEIPGQATSFLVVKLGPSPLPNDRRSCAYLEPTGGGSIW
jgi:hypothetical protein